MSGSADLGTEGLLLPQRCARLRLREPGREDHLPTHLELFEISLHEVFLASVVFVVKT